MPTRVDRPDFTPPPEGGLTRSIGMALLAHAVLLAALSWGVKWKRDEPATAVEAELWANAPVQAAPKPVEAPPAPPPPPPAPTPAPAPPQPTQAERDAEIAVQQEKERQREAQERARREEAERQRELAERRRQQEQARQEQAKQEQAKQEQAKQEQAKRMAAEAKRKEEQARARRRQEEEEEKRLAELRQDNLRRIQGLAGATGPREATGTAVRSAGPSGSYAGRLAAHFQRHVLFPGGVDTIAGNPLAVVQVRVSPTGEIMSARLSKSSGNPAWDEAAVRAIERSERIPADVDGRYVTEFPVEMRPKR